MFIRKVLKLNKLKKKALILFILSASILTANSQIVEVPYVEYVTVNHLTGKPVIKWSVNNTALISGYIIKRKIYSCPGYSSNWHNIKIIDNSSQTIYEDNSFVCEAMPNIRKEKYIIRAFKITGNDTLKSSISEIHETIFLEAQYDFCKKANRLIWNNYSAWEGNFSSYEIFAYDFISGYIKIGNTNYNDTTFTHLNVDYNKNYKYYIKAIKNSGTESVSNIQTVYTQDIDRPSFLKTDSLIVNNKINLWYSVDADSDTKRYILYKSSDINEVYDSIAGINNKDNLISATFTDDYNKKRNYYYLSAIDYCGDEIIKSNIVSNIVLDVKKEVGNQKINNLEWQGNLNTEYLIVRCEKDKANCSIINSIYGLSYSDNIQNEYENQFEKTTEGVFCYYLVSENENLKNLSNTDCVIYDETIFLANAFNPNSRIEENRTFKPKIAFISNYELTIYGNFGNVIFKTNNPNYGWNGKLRSGKLAPRASYLYFINYTNSKGKKISKKGYVSLVY